MDWKIFFATFGTIFLAELGDKTQVAAIAASAETKAFKEVLLGVVLALAMAGTLGVAFGKLLSDHLNPNVLRYLSGGLFVVMGLFILFKR